MSNRRGLSAIIRTRKALPGYRQDGLERRFVRTGIRQDRDTFILVDICVRHGHRLFALNQWRTLRRMRPIGSQTSRSGAMPIKSSMIGLHSRNCRPVSHGRRRTFWSRCSHSPLPAGRRRNLHGLACARPEQTQMINHDRHRYVLKARQHSIPHMPRQPELNVPADRLEQPRQARNDAPDFRHPFFAQITPRAHPHAAHPSAFGLSTSSASILGS